MKFKFYILFLLLPAAGITQRMVKDINSYNGSESFLLSSPKPVNINNTIFFVANDGINGIELWKTDGTAAGTSMVRDIFPGPDDGNPQWLTEMNGLLYFAANDGVHGVELWKSDGTPSGTTMVKNIVPSNDHSAPTYLVNNNGVLFFCAGGEPNTTYLPDRELWKSDGTEAGTEQVANINPTNSAEPSYLTVFNNEVYFVTGTALWKSDGTTTIRISPPNFAVGGTLVPSGNYLYFSALTPSDGNELCKTDGTEPGTGMVKNIHLTGGSLPSLLTDVNGTLFFVAADGGVNSRELWKSDGTEAGTVQVKDIYTSTFVDAPPADLVNFNGTLFFTAYESATGRELWKSDGTEAGTILVKDINPTTATTSHSGLTVVGNTIFFAGRDNNGTELYKSDGTAAGTVAVKDIHPGNQSSSPTILSPISLSASPGNPAVVFSATTNTNGRELWVSDGTEAGTNLIRNVHGDNANSNVTNYVFSNGTIYFSADTRNEGTELWKSDGTEAGTVFLKDLNPGISDGNPQYLTNFGGYVYFTSTGNFWRTDGTPTGTIIIKSNLSPQHTVAHNGLLYFMASQGTFGAELWRSDGTDAGTFMLKDIRPGGSTTTRNSSPQNFNRLGNSLLFTAIDPTGTRQLWKTDGTEAGTVKIIPSTNITAMGSEFAVAGGLLFFTAQASGTGTELWRSDGTDAGTFMAKNIWVEVTPGFDRSSDPKHLTALGNIVLFCAQDNFGDGSTGRELWRSDGTGAGTVMVKDINNVPVAVNPQVEGGSYPAQFSVVGNTAYFYAYTPFLGRELWKTDGTEAGTVVVNDASPGNTSGVPDDFKSGISNFKPAVVNDAVYYPSGSPSTGIELYKADNSGATLVRDIIAGTQGSSPERLFAADDALYFYNDESVNGRELWRYDPLVDYSLPVGSVQVNININEKNTAVFQNQLITRIKQTGVNPLNHNVLTKVTVDPSVQTYNSQPYVQRHYDIEPEWDAANATATITLFFTQDEFTSYNAFVAGSSDDLPSSAGDAIAKSRLRVIQYHGVGTAPGNYPGASQMIDPDDTKIVWNSDGNWWEVTFDVTGFSGFYVTSISGALPVKLMSFSAKKGLNQSVNLQWKVADQQGIDKYVIERSLDGQSFIAIGNVQANSFTTADYYYNDDKPRNINYYRLKIMEANGQFSYSKVEMIKLHQEEYLKVYPNPVADKLLINTNGLTNIVKARLYNSQGALVLQHQWTAAPVLSLAVNMLPAGTYQIILSDGRKEVQASFIKN